MIHHFYHIYADGKWEEPVTEHVRALKMTGLIDNLTTFRVGLVGSLENRTAVANYLGSQEIRWGCIAAADSGWEAVTQQPMHDFSQSNNGLILYAHTKGAYDNNEVNRRWRRSMTWHNVIQWQKAIEKLKDHGSYGSHWIYPMISMVEHKVGNPMYAGTFFWTHCEMMRTWMRVPLTHRHESEGWIGYKYVEQPWRIWDCTPYFPNSDTFMDAWIDDPNYNPEERGKSIEVPETVTA